MKHLRQLTVFGLSLWLGAGAFAQNRCHTTEYMDHLMLEHPEIAAQMEAIEAHTQRVIDQGATQRSASSTYTIPVVFHVVYNGASENIPDNVLLGQLDVLNEDFGAYNTDISSVIPAFSSLWADTDIQFCLASVDPNGNPTTGITRTPTSVSAFSTFSNNVKSSSSGGKDAWPANQYLNIWVCDISGGILGYAQFPGGPASTDGVVVDYLYTGRDSWSSGPVFPFNRGRTLTHEVGHWLNLRHIWGDGGCSVDDGVSDTPTSSSPNYGCPLSASRCSSLDNVQNYMDYTDDACMVMFTAGQGARMRATLVPGGSRNSVANAAATKCSAVSPSCEVPSGLNTLIITAPTSARVSWNPVSGASFYELQGRQAGGPWKDVTVPGTQRTFNIFQANRTYEWRVRANCGSEVSAYSAIQSFVMPPARLGQFETSLSLFPNPAESQLTIDVTAAHDGTANLMITDLLGRVLINQQVAVQGGQANFQLDVSSLNNGTYFATLELDGERRVANFAVAR